MSLDPERANYLTASCFGAALGISSAFQTRAGLWREMTGREQGTVFQPAVDYGNENEPRALAEYEIETGYIIQGRESRKLFTPHPTIPFLSATPDGFVGNDGLVEVKTPYRAFYTAIPAHYLAQVHGQIQCTGRAWCDFFVWWPESPPLLVHVERDDEVWARMLERLTEFWQYILDDKEPPRMSKKSKFEFGGRVEIYEKPKPGPKLTGDDPLQIPF